MVPGAVVDLPGHGEAVPGVEVRGGLVARGRGAVEEPDAVLAVVYSIAEDRPRCLGSGPPV